MIRSLSLIAALGVAGCAHRFGPATPPELRLSTNPDVRWETGGAHDVALILENDGSEPIPIPEPSPAQAYVVVFDVDGRRPICRKGASPGGESKVVELAPRERRALVLRLESCNPPPGQYRYEAGYDVPEAKGAAWSGRVGPEHGRIVVERPSPVESPASRSAVSPPEHAEPPPPASPRSRPGVPPDGPASLACVDRELTRRGLNAYGDPAGTLYPGGPPALASEVEREKMILERYPDLATLCRIPP